MTHFSEIERDLDWREAELAQLRLLLSDTQLPKRIKLVLFRAAWALLYAHFEGFCKFSLTVYYDALRKSGLPCNSLPFLTQCFALSNPVKNMRNLPTHDFVGAILDFQVNHLTIPPVFPDVNTNSNLYADLLQELIIDADIQLPSLSLHNKKIDTLVRRRNKIAHGERDIITELKYYISYEDAVKIIAYELAFAIDQKLGTFGI
jgi:hypothetical protein